MKKCERLLANLPMTTDELAAVLETTTKRVNGLIYMLQKSGKVKKDPLWIGHSEKRGPKPSLWVLSESVKQ